MDGIVTEQDREVFEFDVFWELGLALGVFYSLCHVYKKNSSAHPNYLNQGV